MKRKENTDLFLRENEILKMTVKGMLIAAKFAASDRKRNGDKHANEIVKRYYGFNYNFDKMPDDYFDSALDINQDDADACMRFADKYADLHKREGIFDAVTEQSQRELEKNLSVEKAKQLLFNNPLAENINVKKTYIALIYCINGKTPLSEGMTMSSNTVIRANKAQEFLKTNEVFSGVHLQKLFSDNQKEYITVRHKNLILEMKDYDNYALYYLEPVPDTNCGWTIECHGDLFPYERIKAFFRKDEFGKLL